MQDAYDAYMQDLDKVCEAFDESCVLHELHVVMVGISKGGPHKRSPPKPSLHAFQHRSSCAVSRGDLHEITKILMGCRNLGYVRVAFSFDVNTGQLVKSRTMPAPYAFFLHKLEAQRLSYPTVLTFQKGAGIAKIWSMLPMGNNLAYQGEGQSKERPKAYRLTAWL